MDRISYAKSCFSNDLYATETTGIEIVSVEKDYAKCSLLLKKKHKNAMGAVMGGVLYTLADFTFAVAANNEELSTVSISGQIHFLRGVKGSQLIAEAHPLKKGRNNSFFEVCIYDDLNTLIAKASIIGAKNHQKNIT